MFKLPATIRKSFPYYRVKHFPCSTGAWRVSAVALVSIKHKESIFIGYYDNTFGEFVHWLNLARFNTFTGKFFIGQSTYMGEVSLRSDFIQMRKLYPETSADYCLVQ